MSLLPPLRAGDLPALDAGYVATGKVRWVFINFPLSSMHPNAVAAAEVALCAAKQGAFWRVHDLLYQPSGHLGAAQGAGAFPRLAGGLGEDLQAGAVACLASPDTRTEIRPRPRASERAGASSTPRFYIEGGLMEGAQPLEVFRQVLDSVVATKHRPGT